jgi:hypothetical protein
MCNCIRITYKLTGEETPITIQVDAFGALWNGENYFVWNHLGIDYFLYFNNSGGGQWEVSDVLGGNMFDGTLFISWKDSTPPCPPFGEIGSNWISNKVFDTFKTEACVPDCGCGIVIEAIINENSYLIDMIPTGILNGQNVFQGIDPDNGLVLSMWFDGLNTWFLTWGNILIGDDLGTISVLIQDVIDCPISTNWENSFRNWRNRQTLEKDCGDCGLEERVMREYKSIKLPEGFEEEDRGLRGCCDCELPVLASGSSNDYENDIVSAWLKLSDVQDTVSFRLIKPNGSPANYIPTAVEFVNEPNAWFTTIQWKDVLASDGEGCFKLIIKYNISGVEGSLTWGLYKLQKWSIQNALKTARVHAFFNSYHEIEQINFTGSNVESTFRFYGYIGNRQPNTELDNLIYQNREMKRVIRENLNQWEIITDPSKECVTRPLIDLFLLSENQLFISDYNAHNHSYQIKEIPVIVEDSPEVEYFDFSRMARLTCIVGDKFKNKRTFYK